MNDETKYLKEIASELRKIRRLKEIEIKEKYSEQEIKESYQEKPSWV